MAELRLKDIANIDNLKKAVRFVKQDKADEYIHCPLYDLPYLSKLDEKLIDLQSRLEAGTYQPQKSTILEIIKSSFTTRPISHINIEDWIVAQAILNKVAPILDAKVPQNSFAFRVNPKRDNSAKHKFFKSWYRDWPKFIRMIRDSIKDELPCLLVTDIAGYFENIDLNRLKQMVIDAGVSQEVADLLSMQLESWVWRYLYVTHRQRGLLQGNDASSLYANFYLYNMDKYFEGKGIVYQRFMDDIDIHAENKSQAKLMLGKVNQILRNKGLTINTAKTYILEGDEIEDHFLFSMMDEIESLLKDMKKDGDVPAVKEKRGDIYKRLCQKKRINSHLFKRLITAYIRARDTLLFEDSLQYLELYPDLTEKLCQYYRSIKGGDLVAAGLLDFLEDADKNLFASQEQMLLECLFSINILSPTLRERIVKLSDSKIHSRDCNYYSKSLYALMLYKFGGEQELQKVVELYLGGKEQEIVLKEHLALCATRLRDEGMLMKVIERLKREANPELTELGVFIEEAKSRDSIKGLLKNKNLKTFQFGKDKVLLLDVRDLLLLNILKFNNRKSNAQLLEDHINRYEGKIACERTVELLEEIQAHLKAEAMMELVCSS